MRAAVLGAGGQLGRALTAPLPDADAFAPRRPRHHRRCGGPLDDWSRYDTMFNAAAYTAVDGAETPEGRDAAWAANASA